MVTALERMLANSLSDCVSGACFSHYAFRLHTYFPRGYLLNSKAELSLATVEVYFHLHQKLFIPISFGFKFILPFRHQPFLFHADCFLALQACSPGNGHTAEQASRQALSLSSLLSFKTTATPCSSRTQVSKKQWTIREKVLLIFKKGQSKDKGRKQTGTFQVEIGSEL